MDPPLLGHRAQTWVVLRLLAQRTDARSRPKIGERMRHFLLVPLLVVALGAAYNDYVSAKRKFDDIESGRLRAGQRVTLNQRELTAYVEKEAPAGVRSPRIELTSPEIATGAAMIDFLKVRRAQGYQPGWLMSKLLDGERPVRVTARIHSGGGTATVEVQKVEISGITVDGKTLDFLIRNFLLAQYPDAAVNRPFEMGHHIDRLDVQSGAVNVVIGK
jgi:hypothetical protein